MAYRLNAKQKWKLVLSLMVIYYPIFLYIFFPNFGFNTQADLGTIIFLLADGLIIILFYFIWVNASEWILHKLSNKFGEDFLLDFKLSAQLIAVAICIGLAISFIIAHRNIMIGIVYTSEYLWNIRIMPDFNKIPREVWAFFNRANMGFFFMLMLSSFYLIANRRAQMRMKEMYYKADRLEKESLQAQFAALKNQISPHFLFNSLSILSSLVHIDADLSEKFIDKLSRAYRYILEQKDNEQVVLKTELEFIQSYVFLLKIRFEDKFDVVINIPETVWTQYRVAPFTLQLLVENVVKHNQMSSEAPLRICMFMENNYLVVENNLQPRPQTALSTGIGLQNIINRYSLLTDRQVRVGESDGKFIIKIPLLL